MKLCWRLLSCCPLTHTELKQASHMDHWLPREANVALFGLNIKSNKLEKCASVAIVEQEATYKTKHKEMIGYA